MTASALAVSAALLGIASAALFAIRSREAERAAAGLGDRLASALREAERLRALSRVEASDRSAERDRLRDLVRRLSRHLANYITSESENDLLREARAAIGGEKQ